MAGGWSEWLSGLAATAGGVGLVGGMLLGASPLALAAAGALGVGGLVGLAASGRRTQDHPETRSGDAAEARSVDAAETRSRDPAETRIARAVERSQRRRERGRLDRGFFTTQTGELTINRIYGQRMSQTSKKFYGGESLGSLPAYSAVREGVSRETAPAIYGADVDVSGMSNSSRLAATLGIGLANVSEEDREPGAGKFIRALARRYSAEADAKHPFDPAVNPSVGKGGAQDMRELLGGQTRLSNYQRDTYDAYASDSSDSEDDYFVRRKKVIRPSDIR